MGVAIGDYDRNGTMDIFKTNFAGDTSTLYANSGDGFCEDRTFAGGIGVNTRWLGWGAGFVDLDNDGWLDVVPGQRPRLPRGRRSSRPRPATSSARSSTATCGDGRFEDVERAARRPRSRRRGPAAAPPSATIDNDGDVDVAGQQRQRHARPLPPGRRSGRTTGCSLKLVGHALEPQRDRRARALRRRRRDAVAGGARRRQLHLAERPARALRPRRGADARRAAARCAGRTASRRTGATLAADRILTADRRHGTPGRRRRRRSDGAWPACALVVALAQRPRRRRAPPSPASLAPPARRRDARSPWRGARSSTQGKPLAAVEDAAARSAAGDPRVALAAGRRLLPRRRSVARDRAPRRRSSPSCPRARSSGARRSRCWASRTTWPAASPRRCPTSSRRAPVRAGQHSSSPTSSAWSTSRRGSPTRRARRCARAFGVRAGLGRRAPARRRR